MNNLGNHDWHLSAPCDAVAKAYTNPKSTLRLAPDGDRYQSDRYILTHGQCIAVPYTSNIVARNDPSRRSPIAANRLAVFARARAR